MLTHFLRKRIIPIGLSKWQMTFSSDTSSHHTPQFAQKTKLNPEGIDELRGF
jgi:hypothetical protein